ncbi:MAG: DUF4388 domain-containing protein [Planctomycetota bacterium]|jgi:outer membrane protein assembly factor BamB/tetratricopeptide (TPR) repeat protein
MTQQEGTLYVQDSEGRKAIYFSKEGVSLITSGAKKGGKLGDMLVGLGKIAPEQLEEALSIHSEANIRLGEAMIRLGFVTEKDIEQAVRIQIEEEIYDLFSWENASFEFVEGSPPDGTFDPDNTEVTQLTFNVNSLIMEAARRIDEWDLIEKVIPSVREVFLLDKRVNPLEYTDRERMILQFVEGQNSVKEVVDKSHVPKFDVCKFLYRLIEEGKVHHAPFEHLLEMGDEAVRAEDLQEAVKFYEQALAGKIKKKSDQFKARLRLAQALEYLDKKKEAADQYKILADTKIEDHDVEGAINIWQKVIDLNPLDLENKERLINVYLENRGHLDPGRSDVIRSIEYSLFKNGKSLAMAFAYAGQIDRAKEVLNRLIELVPSNVELRKALANIHLDAGEKAEAVEELERIAQFLLANREFDELLEVYKSIIKIDPSRNDIRKKISMIEAGETVGPPIPRSGMRKTVLILALVLILLGGAGGVVYYQIHAQGEWSRVEREAKGLWEESGKESLPAEEKGTLRKEAREKVKEIAPRFPLTPVKGKADALLATWNRKEEEEEEDRKQVLQTQAKAVAAVRVEMEALYKGNAPLDIAIPVKKIDQVVRDHGDNEYAQDDIQALKELKVKFQTLRETAEEILKKAKAAEKEGERTGEYKRFFTIAWTHYGELFTKGKRFLDLWNQIRLPIRFETSPPGVKVFTNGEGPAKSPFTYYKKPNLALHVKVTKVGRREQEKQIEAENIASDPPSEFELRCIQRFELEIVPLAPPFHLEKENVVSDPVARGGMLFLANDLGDVIALGLGKTLEKKWTIHPSTHGLDQGFKTRLLASSKFVYLPCEDGRVYRVGMKTQGKPADTLSTYPPPDAGGNFIIRERGGAALSADESVLVVGTNRGVLAFDTQTQKLLWKFILEDTNNRAFAVPVCHEGKAYAGTDSGEILVFDLKKGLNEGKPLWRIQAGGRPIRSALAVYNGILYGGNEKGDIITLDLGKMEATTHFIGVDTPITCKPLYAEGFLFVTAGVFLYKLTVPSMVPVWKFDGGGKSGKTSAPAMFGESIFFGNGDGWLYSVDWTKPRAQIRWREIVQGHVKVRPAVDEDGTVYFLIEDKKEDNKLHILVFRE